jgi:prevent-host-death family protein
MIMVTDHSHEGFNMSRIIKASEFKAKCLAVLDEVERTRQTVVITKRGKPVAELVPHKSEKREFIGLLKGRMEIIGDIISPIDVEWEALK